MRWHKNEKSLIIFINNFPCYLHKDSYFPELFIKKGRMSEKKIFNHQGGIIVREFNKIINPCKHKDAYLCHHTKDSNIIKIINSLL